MTTIIGVTFICLYAVLDGLGDAFIFRWMKAGVKTAWEQRLIPISVSGARLLKLPQETADHNTNWHRAQAAQQALVILVTAYLSGCWQIVVLGAGLFWLLHDGIVNRIGLERPWFFVGTTAWLDRQFQKFRNPQAAMAVAKFGLIAAGIVSFFIKL